MRRDKETVIEQLKSNPIPYAVGGLVIFTTGILAHSAAAKRRQREEIIESGLDTISARVLQLELNSGRVLR